MSKLIPMEQAATMLGMSVEQINELRSNQEIFGYKDGGTWKFKMTELERVADNLGINLGGLGDAAAAVTDKAKDVADSFDDLDFGDSEELLLDDDSSGDSMGLDIDEDSSVELMQSAKSSDIFSDLEEDGVTLEDSGLLPSGTSKDLDKKDDDLLISNSDEIDLGESGSLKLQGESSLKLDDSGVLSLGSGSEVLDDDDQLSFGTSDISLASGSSKKLKDGDTGSDVLSGEEASEGSASDTGKMLGEAGGDDLLLAEDDLFEDDLVLQDSASFEDSSDLGSDFDESDLILDDSDSSSELALEANQSGISLSPNESGISLGDEPLELGGSDIDELELPEDDMIVLEDAADPEAATMMQEDDFNLTPLEQSLDGDDSSGSSSQVIALEDSEIYADESEATILGESDASFGEPALVDDGFGAEAGFAAGAAAAGGAMIPGMAMDGTMVQTGPAGPPEAEYSLMNLLALGGAAMIIFLGALLAFDTCRNLWVGDGSVVSSGFLNFVIETLGMKN
ncbi:helix-turn-helix domain-containing protein [Mariniblastus fucicola]|uniref:Helix-turn-helix domain protein n=1 Tax=Mariniblastus fucicola TaxID=980251 RepID=A0A5B9PN56_9BACT|nr:helix-turn-helix domain-containing protein [Mariniblastus fucicola]QEG23961.1 hypothetical protein MFFC18_38660 [Mariniblastus fucicola]